MSSLRLPVAFKPAGRKSKTHHQMRILSVSPDSQDHAALSRAIDGMPWHIAGAATCRQAIAQIARKHISVVFCEHALADGTWRDILNHLAGKPEAPVLIVTSRLADDRLWAEVLNLGGYDVLAKPFSEQEVRHVLISALMPKSMTATYRMAGIA